jgi:protein TIF31
MAPKPEEPTSAPVDDSSSDESEQSENGADTPADEAPAESLINMTIILPGRDDKIQITVSSQEQVHEVRQSVIDLPTAFQYTCFHLEFKGQRINDFIALADIPDLGTEPEFHLVQDPYTEKEARIHVVRMRELVGAAGDRTDSTLGVLPGLSLFEAVSKDVQQQNAGDQPQEHDFTALPALANLAPKPSEPAPKTIKQIALSSWNPPPPHLRQRGHLLYLIAGTNEGEQYQITAHISGFFVNKSSNAKFDPFPKPAPKGQSAHSLLELLGLISPSFNESFAKLLEHNNQKDPLTLFQITNSLPATPWTVPPPSSALCEHVPDLTRPQEQYLLSGVDSTDTLRDWNEEFQSAKELPKETVQDRVFRERLISKLFADYNDAATRGAVMVARGEIAPLNPTECQDAQIFVYNNIFFSFGADGVGTFTSEGGDEAARVATGKDLAGVKLVNQLDIDGLFTPGTVVVDYFGKRIVAQSIVPGIFKQRDEGEHQIDYGAVDGRDVVANDERFVETFAKLSKALKVKKHPVWDKTGEKFDLESSIETKGLMGTDGRKYVLDLYRITPLDIAWLDDGEDEDYQDEDSMYPHRMTVLRPELIDAFSRYRMKQWVDKELAAAKASKEAEGEEGENKESVPSQPDLSKFQFALNPDAFSGQVPQTAEEKAEWEEDEKQVREAADFLRKQVIPDMLRELKESDISTPMDGQSLSRLLHKRGINVRYTGHIASLCTEGSVKCMQNICIQDMIARSFKHIAAQYLRRLPVALGPTCVSHLLNCLLGHELNEKPVADIDATLVELYKDADLSFRDVNPEDLHESIEEQVFRRFRYELDDDWVQALRPAQLLREVCLQMGLQVQAKEYAFTKSAVTTGPPPPATNGQSNGGESKNKKKKKANDQSSVVNAPPAAPTSFTPDDIIDIVPVVKHSCPRSALAEEALEAGRISLLQGQKQLGQELLLESLSLHEQIYGILHPEVARVYNSLSMLYYQLDEKNMAIELSKKAIVVSERTVGIDSAETLLNYLNLSLFLHQAGDSKSALAFTKHALMLWKVIYGPDHPDSITTLNNGAVMLQNLKEFHESRRWFEESLRVCETVYGKQHSNVATLLFQLAQALALDHDSKAAVHRMRECYNVFLNELGPEDKNTKEAETWLEQLTQNAVTIAKNAKDAQARRIRSGIRFPVASASAAAPVTNAAGTSSAASVRAQASQMDSRSIDDLLKYIEGSEQQAKPSKKRALGNPKRRGGRSA